MEGLDYLHRTNIIHRDIKPGNILVIRENPVMVKLTDFDVSKFFSPDIETSEMSSNVGTLAFKAPEFFQRSKDETLRYHRSVDVYALGLTFLAMIQRNKPLVPTIETAEDDSELHNPIGATIASRVKYRKGPYMVLAGHACINVCANPLIHSIKYIISKMTHFLPEMRISPTTVLQMLTGNKTSNMVSQQSLSLHHKRSIEQSNKLFRLLT